MKRLLIMLQKKGEVRLLLSFVLLSTCFLACHKQNNSPSTQNNNLSHYSSDAIDKWITLQLRLMRNATGIPSVAFSRYYAYTGVAAFEAIELCTKDRDFANVKWNNMTNLPHIDRFKKYYWPASVNTALAYMNRNIFINAKVADKAAIDSLETALNNSFAKSATADEITRSNALGASVAKGVFAWFENDHYKNSSTPYTPPIGSVSWIPTTLVTDCGEY
jgi:hypothetical protein